jgi:predicted dinucleotide-binding enzyme
VMAYNTTYPPRGGGGAAGGQPVPVFGAGADDEAKGKVKELIEAGGMRAIDSGPLERAQQLEQMGFLNIKLQEPLGAGFASALKIHTP